MVSFLNTLADMLGLHEELSNQSKVRRTNRVRPGIEAMEDRLPPAHGGIAAPEAPAAAPEVPAATAAPAAEPTGVVVMMGHHQRHRQNHKGPGKAVAAVKGGKGGKAAAATPATPATPAAATAPVA